MFLFVCFFKYHDLNKKVESLLHDETRIQGMSLLQIRLLLSVMVRSGLVRSRTVQRALTCILI